MISTFVIFAFVTGLLSGGIIVGAITWGKELVLKLNWWKCLLAAFWYILLLFLVFAAFTFVGEGEPVAGWRTLGISTVVMVISGSGLYRVFFSGRTH